MLPSPSWHRLAIIIVLCCASRPRAGSQSAGRLGDRVEIIPQKQLGGSLVLRKGSCFKEIHQFELISGHLHALETHFIACYTSGVLCAGLHDGSIEMWSPSEAGTWGMPLLPRVGFIVGQNNAQRERCWVAATEIDFPLGVQEWCQLYPFRRARLEHSV